MFIFERENAKPILGPTAKMLVRQLSFLRCYGKSSFACLTDSEGNWVQVGGGGTTCVLERKEAQTGLLFRAEQVPPVMSAEFDNAELCFGANRIKLRQGEWFHLRQIVEVFICFLQGQPFPTNLRWQIIRLEGEAKAPDEG